MLLERLAKVQVVFCLGGHVSIDIQATMLHAALIEHICQVFYLSLVGLGSDGGHDCESRRQLSDYTTTSRRLSPRKWRAQVR